MKEMGREDKKEGGRKRRRERWREREKNGFGYRLSCFALCLFSKTILEENPDTRY